MTNFREGGLLPTYPWAARKKPIRIGLKAFARCYLLLPQTGFLSFFISFWVLHYLYHTVKSHGSNLACLSVWLILVTSLVDTRHPLDVFCVYICSRQNQNVQGTSELSSIWMSIVGSIFNVQGTSKLIRYLFKGEIWTSRGPQISNIEFLWAF